MYALIAHLCRRLKTGARTMQIIKNLFKKKEVSKKDESKEKNTNGIQ